MGCGWYASWKGCWDHVLPDGPAARGAPLSWGVYRSGRNEQYGASRWSGWILHPTDAHGMAIKAAMVFDAIPEVLQAELFVGGVLVVIVVLSSNH